MQIVLYNIFQITGLILFSPLLLVKAIISPKYRGRSTPQVWYDIDRTDSQTSRRAAAYLDPCPFRWRSIIRPTPGKGIESWLSRDVILIFSASTKTGEKLAREVIKEEIDLFVPFPLDIYFVVRKFINCIRADLFILIETDFWPNFLHILQENNTPAILVNGRISQSSFDRYRRFHFIFLPMFKTLPLHLHADFGRRTKND